MNKNIIRGIVVAAVLLIAISISVVAFMSSKNLPPVTNGQNQQPGTVAEKPAEAGKEGQEGGKEQGEKKEEKPEGEKSKSEKVKVKALYLTGWNMGYEEKVNHYIQLAKDTEINAYVIDIKDDDGYVGYKSEVPAVIENKSWKYKYDADKVVKAFKDNGIYTIGRVVCFKDPVLSARKPELAVKRTNGQLWRDNHGLSWLNPYNKESWPYIIEVAREGVKKGFDEIQFDYIRFPNDGDKKAMNFGNTDKKRHEIINEFISYARKELPGVVLSADVFGIICESPGDTEQIGQYLEMVGMELDYISPMVYPSHYAVGQKVNGVQFMKPDLEPYGVVYQSLAKAKERISKVEGYRAGVRPYLQDFTASWLGKGYYQSYGVEQVKQQIKAVYDAGYEEWILWDSNNTYTEQALEKE